jgi:DNA repair ATPase RecN
MNLDENHLILDEVLEQEISLYNFENAMSRISMEAQKKSEEAQKRFEEAQKRFEEAQKRFEEAQKRFEEAQKRFEEAHSNLISIQESRIWRYTSVYRKLGGKIKVILKSSSIGKFLLRILKKILG